MMKLMIQAPLLLLALFVVTAAAAAPDERQSLQAELKADRVAVLVNGETFTEYLFLESEKYPYFYPVNGPRTGRSVTERRLQAFPHHSSLFFSCDRVNGGNYWQEGLDRGRIVSKEVRVLRDAGDEILIEQTCRWERPNAEAPFDDFRKIRITAPSPHIRHIDFEVTLTARTNVRIQRNNHSLFSARMAPDLSVVNGGVMRNAEGASGEEATFGKPSPWMDYRGERDGETEGMAMLCHPANPWFPAPWFTRDYGFISPTPMYWLESGAMEIPRGESLHLRYRVVIHGNNPPAEEIDAEFRAWSESAR
jgi:hypothetical protein